MSLVKNMLRRAFRQIDGSLSAGLLPAYRLAARWGRYRIPVLVYHRITDDAATAARLTCALSARAFEQQMDWLAREGFKPLAGATYVDCLAAGRPFPPRSVLLTFDDGYRSVYTRAYPILQRHVFPAVVFVASDLIGSTRWFPDDEKYRDLPAQITDELTPLTWEQVRAMSGLVAVGSHTASHPHLARLSPREIEHELQASKQEIASRSGQPVYSFAYPHGIRAHGDYSAATRAAVAAAGYRVAFISEIGRNRVTDDPYLQRRIEPRETDSRRLFLSKLLGAYDWVGLAQGTFHRVFRPDGVG